MKDNRKIWLNSFNRGIFPNWNCPRCNNGILRPVNNSFHYWESADSHNFGRELFIKNDIKFDEKSMLGMELSEYRYSVLLKCNSCSEIVSSCGSGQVVEDYYPELSDTATSDEFSPEYFYPSLNIFPISEKCPKPIAIHIKNSFKLFFADPSASANYVRKAVEEILTDKKIKRYIANKHGKRVKVSLHDRIIEFEKSKPEIAKKLLAIKWVGNEGSHTDKLTKNAVLDVYEILEEAIDDLYVGYKRQLEKKINKINKSKKPLYPST